MTTVGDQSVSCPSLPLGLDTESAIEVLGDAEYGVVVDHDGPVAIVDAADLRAGDLPPAILVPADRTLAELADSPILALVDAFPDIHGFVAIEHDGSPRGVLPIGLLDDYLGSGRFVLPPRVMGPGGYPGDLAVAGDPRLPRARIRCRAPGCGYVNALEFFDRYNPPQCENVALRQHRLLVR